MRPLPVPSFPLPILIDVCRMLSAAAAVAARLVRITLPGNASCWWGSPCSAGAELIRRRATRLSGSCSAQTCRGLPTACRHGLGSQRHPLVAPSPSAAVEPRPVRLRRCVVDCLQHLVAQPGGQVSAAAKRTAWVEWHLRHGQHRARAGVRRMPPYRLSSLPFPQEMTADRAGRPAWLLLLPRQNR